MELLKKLRIKVDEPLWVIEAPDDCIALFDGIDVKEKLPAKQSVGQLILFARDSKTLDHYMERLADKIKPETLFWIFSPKKSGSVSTDLVAMDSFRHVFSMGYRGQTSVAVNEDWSGLRVTNAPPKKPSTFDLPPEERNIEGIDFVKRTVQLPADAKTAMKQYKGMEQFFDTLSFTCKKEYAEAIVSAKKEETRVRRIEKTIEMLGQKMQEKELKKK